MLAIPEVRKFINNERIFRNYIQHGSVLLQLFCAVSVAILPVYAHAQTGDEAKAKLASTLSAIKEANAHQKDLEEQTEKLHNELKELQKETINLANDTGEHEDELEDFEDKLAILEDQKKQKNRELAARQAELSTLISAMIRLKQLPPETIIAMPGHIDETLSAARALSLIFHSIQDDADSLKNQLGELDDLEARIKKSRASIVTSKKDLAAKRAELQQKIKERTALEDKLDSESEETKAKIAQLTEQSHNLEELVEALGRAEAAPPTQPPADNIKASSIRKEHRLRSAEEMRPFPDVKGHLRMPAKGKIVRHFAGSGEDSALSRGITIETREGSSVLAPFDGEVVYAGSFRDYGRIIIIRHSDDYHTLLSGMEHINCTPGQFLMEGEPIGTMGTSQDTRRLYVEVRKDHKPIDPLPWFKSASLK